MCVNWAGDGSPPEKDCKKVGSTQPDSEYRGTELSKDDVATLEKLGCLDQIVRRPAGEVTFVKPPKEHQPWQQADPRYLSFQSRLKKISLKYKNYNDFLFNDY